MATTPPQAPPPSGPPKGGKRENVFTRKIGPMPMWLWLAIAAGLVLLYVLYESHKSSTTGKGKGGGGGHGYGRNLQPPMVFQFPPENHPRRRRRDDDDDQGDDDDKKANPGGPRGRDRHPRRDRHGKGHPATKGRPSPQEYTVRRGDTLSGIAQAQHVQGGWRALYADNRRTVGSNPNLIRPGERLKV